MKINIENIGKIKEAEIKIDGLTVIAGENNTGKTTLNKSLYTSINSICNYHNKIIDEKTISLNSIPNYIDHLLQEDNEEDKNSDNFTTYFSIRQEYNTFIWKTMRTNVYENNNELIENIISEIVRIYKNNDVNLNNKIIENIRKYISNRLNVKVDEILNKITTKEFQSEFSNQIFNINEGKKESTVKLNLNNQDIIFKLNDNKVIDIINPIDINKKIIYIDGQVDFNNFNNFNNIRKNMMLNNFNNHNDEIYKMLSDNSSSIVQEMITDKKLADILKEVNEIAPGDIESIRNSTFYVDGDKKINFNNVSSGMKSFVLIKELLMKQKLEQDGILILDEPEIHLHPDWQIVFAKIVVLLQKKFDLHILCTTHSPYFLRALGVFSKKYKIENNINYYLSENTGNISKISDVTSSIEEIYKLMAEPFDTLDELEYSEDN